VAVSKKRKKSEAVRVTAPKKPSANPPWLVPTMGTLLILGPLWIIAYYIGAEIPFMSDLGVWNLAIGFGILTAGFVLLTRWR